MSYTALGDGADVFDGRQLPAQTVFAGGGNDTVLGGAGNDRINGGEGRDAINGGGGNDVIRGGEGADRVAGGTGNDTFAFFAGDLSERTPDGLIDVIVDFAGAGVRSYLGENDIINFFGFGAGATLEFERYGFAGGVERQDIQIYTVSDGTQSFELQVQMKDNSQNFLVEGVDYAFRA